MVHWNNGGCVLDLLNQFPPLSSQTGRAHLILVSITPGKPGGAIGIITLEGEFSFALFFSFFSLRFFRFLV